MTPQRGDPGQTVDELLRGAVRDHGDRPALVFGGGRLSYAELDAAAETLARRLVDAAGEEPAGRRVAVIAPNTPALVVSLFAIWRAGATAVPLNARLREHELGQILADAQPVAVVSVESHLGYSFRELANRLAPELPSVRAFLFVDARGQVDAAERVRVETTQAPRPAADTAAVLYTSGTSGVPKGAVVPHRRELDGASHLASVLGLRPDDAAVFVIPLSHAFGFTCLLACVRTGAASVLVDSTASLRPLLEAVAGTGASVLHGSPQLFTAVLEATPDGLPGVRTGFVAGAPSPPRLLQRLDANGMRILNVYGLTETGAVSSCRADDPAEVRHATAGRPLPGHELRTVDGELQILSPYGVRYLDRRDETEAAHDGGWFRTGDLATVEDGLVRITGRLSELVNVGGFNVSPAEVEAVLLGHAGVEAVAVVGIGDAASGETLQAFVVPRAGAQLERADLLRFARARIAGYKLPYAIHVVPELPLLPSGKPDRQALRHALAAAARAA